ncbi:MAG: fatty acid desaturase [Rhizobiaceae bacterium]
MNMHTGAGGPNTTSRTPQIEWLTVALIALCYGTWFAVGFWLWPVAPVLAVIVLALTVALQSSLMHECLHGHPTKIAWLNELLVSLPIGLVWPYRRFKALHLRHHADERLTDPFEDPESYYQAFWNHENYPRWFKAVLRFNNTLGGRVLLNPLLGAIGLAVMDVRLMAKGDRAVMGAWVRQALGWMIVVPVVLYGFGMPIWIYLLGPTWLGKSIIAVRTYAEHQWHETPEGRTIIVERSCLSVLFLNNNLHLVHHKNPTTAWYKLPKLFAERRAEWTAMNGAYVFPNYFALIRAYLFKAKEPVVHPALRRDL